MTIGDRLREIGQGLLEGAVHLATEASVDVANSYQAVLMQDTGWNVQSVISDMTQQRAGEISNRMVDEANEMENSIEHSL